MIIKIPDVYGVKMVDEIGYCDISDSQTRYINISDNFSITEHLIRYKDPEPEDSIAHALHYLLASDLPTQWYMTKPIIDSPIVNSVFPIMRRNRHSSSSGYCQQPGISDCVREFKETYLKHGDTPVKTFAISWGDPLQSILVGGVAYLMNDNGETVEKIKS